MKPSYLFETVLAVGMSLVTMTAGRGQGAPRALAAGASQEAAATSETQAQAMAKPAQVRAGSKLQAELESAVDTHTAKPGDQVTARVTQNVKEHGRVVIHKGDRLVGHITDVENSASARSGSHVEITFDELVSGGQTSRLNAVVTSVLISQNEAQAPEDIFNEPAPLIPPMPRVSGTASSSSSGGLLGSVGSAAGSAVGSAGSAAGSVVSSAGASAGAAGSTLENVGGAIQSTTQTSAGTNSSAGLATPARAIHLSSQTQANQQSRASSVFSTKRGGLRLDSGTRLEFKVAASGEAQEPPK